MWFIDSDCKAAPDALKRLLPHMVGSRVAAVGGSYENLRPEAWLASTIHEEIIERHLRMPVDVDFLATFNVLYRRSVLLRVGGFDESFRLAQDVELAYRVRKAGYRLRFEVTSRVGHFHPTALRPYLTTQTRHGYFRVLLYYRHPERVRGDNYSGLLDYVQPPMAVIALLLIVCGGACSIAAPIASKFMLLGAATAAAVAIGASIPLAAGIVRRNSQLRFPIVLSLFVMRSAARGIGMSWSLCRLLHPAVAPKRLWKASCAKLRTWSGRTAVGK